MDTVDVAGSPSVLAKQRPWWRRVADFPLAALLIAIALFIAANALAVLVLKLLPQMDRPLAVTVNGAIAITLLFATYKLAIRHLGERPHDDLPLRQAVAGLGLGLLFGFLLFSLVVAVAAALDVYNIVGQGGFGELVPALIGMAIIPAFMEEVLFRGIMFRWIEEFAGSWAALAITSAFFGLTHMYNPNASALSSFAIALEAGILLGGIYMLTRNLWAAIGLHAAWNFTQGFIFDVPVSGIDQQGAVEAKLSGPELLSGGAFGLEASLIAIVIATAAGAYLVVLAVRRNQLVRPWWVRLRIARTGAQPSDRVEGALDV